MKKVLIIEDELPSAKRLEKLLLEMDDTLEIDGPLQSIREVVGYLHSHDDYDLIFSDIRLLDGDVFTAFQEVLPSSFVIFTTAYDEYAMSAIKNHGIDYLLKPVDEDELRKAINKVKLTPKDQDLAGVVRQMHKGDDRPWGHLQTVRHHSRPGATSEPE